MCAFHIYAASCVPEGGIYHYVYENGKMRQISKTAADRPMYLAVADDRIYAVLREPFPDSSNSGLCWWNLDADGNLYGQSEVISTGGRCGCHLTVENGCIYVANYLSGSVAMLPEGAVVNHSGSGVDPVRQEAPHVHFVCSGCTAVLDLPEMEVPRSLCSEAAHQTHGRVDQCQLMFTGLCSTCCDGQSNP